MKNSTLDKVRYSESEEIIEEFNDIEVLASGMGPEATVFKKSKIVLTNQRLIFGQKMLGRDSYVLRYFVLFRDDIPGFKLVRGIVQLKIAAGDFSWNEPAKKLMLKPRESNWVNQIELQGGGVEQLQSQLSKLLH